MSVSQTTKVDGLYQKLEIFDGDYIEGEIKSSLIPIDKRSAFRLPGRDDYKDDCGSIRAIYRCKTSGTLVSHSKSCDAKGCIICYTKWASKRAKSILWRIRAYTHFQSNSDQWYHWILSPGAYKFKMDGTKAEYTEMVQFRQEIKSYFREGIIIFHPYALKCWDIGQNKWIGKKEAQQLDPSDRGGYKWIWQPHFHVLTQTEPSKFLANKIRQLGTFSMVKYKNHIFSIYHPELECYRDPKRILSYELSHAGVWDDRQCYIYFGDLHSSKFKTKELFFESPKVCTCKICKEKSYTNRSECTQIYFKTVMDQIYQQGGNIHRMYKINTENIDGGRYLYKEQDSSTVYKFQIPEDIRDKDKIVRYLSHFFPNFVIENINFNNEECWDHIQGLKEEYFEDIHELESEYIVHDFMSTIFNIKPILKVNPKPKLTHAEVSRWTDKCNKMFEIKSPKKKSVLNDYDKSVLLQYKNIIN